MMLISIAIKEFTQEELTPILQSALHMIRDSSFLVEMTPESFLLLSSFLTSLEATACPS